MKLLSAAFAFAFTLTLAGEAPAASKIEPIVSPGGIKAWLVREPSVPMVAMDFAFTGGANADPAGKPGVANMVSALLDEGAGEMDARAFQERMEERAIQINFSASRDHFRGSLRTLSANLDEGAELLRLSLTSPRFDAEPIERIRSQVLAGLRRSSTNPNDIANQRFWAVAFPGHPYGRPNSGTLETVPLILAEDLKAYAAKVFSRGTLTVGIVGDISVERAGRLLDQIFGGLPEKTSLDPVPPAIMGGLGTNSVSDMDVPQTVITFGSPGVPRDDPDFFVAYVVNHILGGGSHTSRLYREVREARGLAYGVRTSLVWFDHASVLSGATATRSDRAKETISIIESEYRRLATEGPTQEELDKAKSYLRGAYALAFDTSTKIAGQIVQIQLDKLGIDYPERRNKIIDAVTIDDAKRVAKRMLDTGLLFAVAGRANALAKAH